MGSNLDLTSYSFALKEWYSRQKLLSTLYKDSPALALLRKEGALELVGGKYVVKPTTIAGPIATSTLSAAQTYASASSGVAWQITMADVVAAPQVALKVVEAAKDPLGAFMSAMTHEMDRALDAMKDFLSFQLYGTGTGTIGRLSSGGITSGVFTLATPADVVNFRKNMPLETTDADGDVAVTSGSAVGYVIGVNRSTGVVTVAASLGGSAGTPTNWAANKYIRTVGTGNACAKGFQAWLPTATPAATSFFGVDRTADSYLYGVYYNGAALPIEEALISAASQLDVMGSKPDYVFVHPDSYAALAKALMTKVAYVDVGVEDVGVSFRGINLHGPSGDLVVLADRKCPYQTAFMIQSDTWSIPHLGEDLPHWASAPDGSIVRFRDAAMDLEARLVGFFNVACTIPGYSARIALQA